jgi:hypothetical protein
LGRETYRSKVYGCWLGKSIGGTLGGPYEGRPGPLRLTFYEPVPTEPAFNDDLDLQLVSLHALEEHGVEVTAAQLSQEWSDHNIYPWCEYGYSQLNARRGLVPPLTGSYDNWFGDCMGAPIRSEIWACIAPAAPQIACEYAWRDAVRDHWGEGVWGEMFFAAVESAAFVLDDRDTLLDIGLTAIPPWCRVHRVVQQVRDSHVRGYDWLAARERILAEFGRQHMTNAPQNIGFTVLGWLYGQDFGDALLKATNCGRDTDCTAATLGSILGILLGADAIPQRWREPIAEGIKVGWGIVNLDTPTEIGELTARTCALGEEVIRRLGETAVLVDGEGAAAEPEELHRRASQCFYIWERHRDEVWLTDDARVRLWYMGGPAVTPGRRRRLLLVGASGVGIKAPPGWQTEIRRIDSAYELLVTASDDMPAADSLEISAEGHRWRVALLRRPRWHAARLGKSHGAMRTPPKPRRWLPWETEGVEVDLTSLLAGSEGTALLRTRVMTGEDRGLTLHVATPHRARAWLNGELVVTKQCLLPNEQPPYDEPEDSHASVALKTGANDLFVAILSRGGPCMARIYFTDDLADHGHGVPDIYYAAPD